MVQHHKGKRKIPNDLGWLIEQARHHKMGFEEQQEQLVSFVYGNLQLDGIDVSKEDIRNSLDDRN